MIKLSDYLNYLSDEIIQARKSMDLKSIENAKLYSEHEYLKYFKAPRFTMPSIKLEIPIEISALDSQTKYNFKMNEDNFLYHVNKNISTIEKKHHVTLRKFTKEDFSKKAFRDTIKKLEKSDRRYVDNLGSQIDLIDIRKTIPTLNISGSTMHTSDVDKKTLINKEIEDAYTRSFQELFKPTAVKLNNIYISPETKSLKDVENDKILVRLNVELVEENLKITRIKNDDGSIVEEIVLDQ